MTKPLFIVGSGRSGTAAFARMLNKVDNVESRHEYRIPGFPALETTSAHVWVNSDYRMSWQVSSLAWKYPEAKFLHIVRDGRKVTSSFFNKIPLERGSQEPFPGDFPEMDPFRRCCLHWVESNRVVLEAFKELPTERHQSLHLEDIVRDRSLLTYILAWASIPFENWMYEFLQTPRHVLVPTDFPLTDEQKIVFKEVCSEMMETLGYAELPEYDMKYGEYKP